MMLLCVIEITVAHLDTSVLFISSSSLHTVLGTSLSPNLFSVYLCVFVCVCVLLYISPLITHNTTFSTEALHICVHVIRYCTVARQIWGIMYHIYRNNHIYYAACVLVLVYFAPSRSPQVDRIGSFCW